MYTAFYGLQEKPFQLSPDPRFLFLADSHREALAHLLFGIEQEQGFIAVTGEVGTGKTTLCRTLLHRVDPGAEVAIIFNPQLSASELLEAIHVELGLEPGEGSRRELMDRLNRFLLEKKEDGRRVLLIVDEAQTLRPDALEQIRMLSNLETETSKLIQIILLGQPEFDAMLESPSLRQLRQRISVRWRLSALRPTETAEYVRHRLRIAARARREIFSDAALREIHNRSGGIPRVVNLLCDRALLAGYGAGSPTISQSLVRQADEELRGGAQAPSLGPPAQVAPLRRFAPLVGLVALGVLAGMALERLAGPDAAPVAEPSSHPPASDTSISPAPEVPHRAQASGAEMPQGVLPARPKRGPAPEIASDTISDTSTAAIVEAPRAVEGVLTTEVSPASLVDASGLDEMLVASEPGVGTAAALDAVLDAWGLAPAGARSLTLDAATRELRSRGLVVHTVEQADVGSLARLDHLALLTVRAPDGSERHLLLERVGLENVRLVGLLGDATPVEVPRGELDVRVSGVARVVWRDFEGLPPVLRWGFRGPAVEWLQRSLFELGYLATPATGEYDGATVGAVRAFQADRGLHPDGEVGPRTKMALYRALTSYPSPRLAGDGEDAG
jgi:general secretion pathway protein A